MSQWITSTELARYDLPLRRPWSTAAGVLRRRTGWIVRLRASDGRVGYGECAPLPQAGTETAERAGAALTALPTLLCGLRLDAALDCLDTLAATPATRCAAETALLDLLSQLRGVPLAQWLSATARDAVRVNAAAGEVRHTGAREINRFVGEGFDVVKLKVGVASAEHETARLLSLAKSLPPHVRLRLDANRAWPWEQAWRTLQCLIGAPVESVEEPLRVPSARGLHRLQAHLPWPLAVDESLPVMLAERPVDQLPVRRFILKPMVLGGIVPALRIARLAAPCQRQAVVTTTIDSTAGTLAALHLAAALGGDLAHGLATTSWLIGDTGPPPVTVAAHMRVPTSSGLGFQPLRWLRFR